MYSYSFNELTLSTLNDDRAMVIRVAIIGYDRSPEFEVITPETPPLNERIAWALLSRAVFRRACEKEGMNLNLAMKLCGISRTEFEVMKKEQDSRDETGEKGGKKHGGGEIVKKRNWLRIWGAKL
jgi:hypothetical protein